MTAKKLTVLLLGSGGFIGRNLKEQLSSKYRLLAPRSQVLDLADERAVAEYLKQYRPDVLINAAVYAGSRKFTHLGDVLRKNLRFFYNLVRQRAYFGKMIHFGSGAEYDKSQPLVMVREDDFDQRVPKDDYGFYKYICSKYINHEKNIVCLRPFGIYGKYEDYTIRFISNTILRTLFNLPVHINQNVRFDYLYINDLTKIIDWFINHQPNHHFYNVGRGQTIDLITIAHRIISLVESKTTITVKQTGWGNEYSANTNRLKRELQDFKYTDFDLSLKEMIAWYRHRLKQIERAVLLYDK